MNPQDAPKLVGEITGLVEATSGDVQLNEFEDELRGQAGLILYRKMLTDSSISQGMNYKKDVMRNTRFRMRAYSDDPVDLEIAAFCADQLSLDDMRAGKYSFNRLLSLFQDSCVYKQSYGELVFAQGPDGKFVLDKINPLHPFTIFRIDYDKLGGPKAIVQRGKLRGIGGATIDKTVPIWKTIMFTHNDDGLSNGESDLRPAILHWRIKRALLILVNQGLERFALGVPMLKVPTSVKPKTSQWDAARQVCIDYVTRPRMGVLLPDGWEFEIMKMHSTMPDILPYLEYQEQSILRSLGIEFSSVGQKAGTPGTSATSQMSMTQQSVMALLSEFTSAINLYLIPKLVLVNWPDRLHYPRLVADTEDGGDMSAAANLFGMVLNAAMDIVVAKITVKASGSKPGDSSSPSKKFGELPLEEDASPEKVLEFAAAQAASKAAQIPHQNEAELAPLIVDAVATIKSLMPTRMKRLVGWLEDEQTDTLHLYRQGGQTLRVTDGRKPAPRGAGSRK